MPAIGAECSVYFTKLCYKIYLNYFEILSFGLIYTMSKLSVYCYKPVLKHQRAAVGSMIAYLWNTTPIQCILANVEGIQFVHEDYIIHFISILMNFPYNYKVCS